MYTRDFKRTVQLPKLRNKILSMLALKEFRDNRRYTQRDIAKGTNITESLISRAMRSKTLDHLSLYDAHTIADWLECSIYDLFEVSDEEIDEA
jgi:transcriptional regulator with XRE-family HTH domain